jgi:hypothetical protein
VSGVFLNIDPPPPSPPSECVLPPHQRRRGGGGYTLAGWCRVTILEDARHRISLLQYNLSTVLPKAKAFSYGFTLPKFPGVAHCDSFRHAKDV